VKDDSVTNADYGVRSLTSSPAYLCSALASETILALKSVISGYKQELASSANSLNQQVEQRSYEPSAWARCSICSEQNLRAKAAVPDVSSGFFRPFLVRNNSESAP
jgi:hypothetical protein